MILGVLILSYCLYELLLLVFNNTISDVVFPYQEQPQNYIT